MRNWSASTGGAMAIEWPVRVLFASKTVISACSRTQWKGAFLSVLVAKTMNETPRKEHQARGTPGLVLDNSSNRLSSSSNIYNP